MRIVAETESGVIYHDEATDEWLVDVGSKGVTLFFDREDFTEFLELMRRATDYEWDIYAERRSA